VILHRLVALGHVVFHLALEVSVEARIAKDRVDDLLPLFRLELLPGNFGYCLMAERAPGVNRFRGNGKEN